MVIRVAIVGASGYSGAELTALADRHPHIELAGLFSSANGAEIPLADLHPSLAAAKGGPVRPFDLDLLLECTPDLVFLATPNETSADLAPKLLEAGIKVVDLSGAFRLPDASDYPKWYGFEHPSPALLQQAVYGLTEWCNGELTGATLVANPGCYPTSILLALRPLLDLLDPSQPIVCDAKSGVTGAGKRSELAYSFTELSGNFKAYGVDGHKHLPEIRQKLGISGESSVVFVPHLLPTPRGILSTIYVAFTETTTRQAILDRYSAAYASSPFVTARVSGMPELRNVVGTPRAEIGFSLLDDGRRAVIVSVIDNLLKGAASQALQNFNRIFALDEREGLA